MIFTSHLLTNSIIFQTRESIDKYFFINSSSDSVNFYLNTQLTTHRNNSNRQDTNRQTDIFPQNLTISSSDN